MFGMTFGFFLVELIVGYLTNSMALVADSFHMLSDVASIIIAFLSVKVVCCILNVNFCHLMWLYYCVIRCHQKSGPKIRLGGPAQKCWVPWLIQFSLLPSVSLF